MHVGFSEEQTLLRESAREFLSRECPISLVREQMGDTVGFPEALWKQMAELGWVGLIVDEAHGGSGMNLVDLAVLLEEMGRALVPGPFLSTAVIGASAIRLAGSPEQQAQWLPRLAEGGLRVALAQLEGDEASWEPRGIQLAALPHGDGYRLSGRKLFVADAACADRLLVACRTGPPGPGLDQGVSLLLVDAASEGVRIRPIACNEQSRKLCEVAFDDVTVPGHDRLGTAGSGWPALARVLDIARLATCAELSGGAQKVLELSVQYAQNREQFGQPIGRFQALQHKCADMLVRAEGMRSATYYAAWSLANDEPDAHVSACLAKAYSGDAYARVAGDGIQIHGGLGFTWEQDLQLYFKQAQAAGPAFGDAVHCRELAARVLIDQRRVSAAARALALR